MENVYKRRGCRGAASKARGTRRWLEGRHKGEKGEAHLRHVDGAAAALRLAAEQAAGQVGAAELAPYARTSKDLSLIHI